jgi:hypothetical protein
MLGLFNVAVSICMWLTATAAVIAGFRLFQRWNRGDDIEQAAVLWLTGLLVAPGVILLVKRFIVSGSFSQNTNGINGSGDYVAAGAAQALAYETFWAALVAGLVVALVGLISILQKFQRGDDDLYEYMAKWAGSIVFLFSFGYVISLIL